MLWNRSLRHLENGLLILLCACLDWFVIPYIKPLPLSCSCRFLDQEHSTGSKIWCCFPQCRTPVCVMSVTVKSASGLEKTSRLSMSKRNFNFVAYDFEEGWFSWSVLHPGEGVLPPWVWLSQQLRKWSGNKKYCKVREKPENFTLSQGKFIKSLKKVREKWNFKSTRLFFSLHCCWFLTFKILLHDLQTWIMLFW